MGVRVDPKKEVRGARVTRAPHIHGPWLSTPLVPKQRTGGLGTHQHQRSEEHTSELQSRFDLVCRLLPTSTLFPYTTLFRSKSVSNSLQHVTKTRLVPQDGGKGRSQEGGARGKGHTRPAHTWTLAFYAPCTKTAHRWPRYTSTP